MESREILKMQDRGVAEKLTYSLNIAHISYSHCWVLCFELKYETQSTTLSRSCFRCRGGPVISSKDLPLIPLLSFNKSAKLVFINPTLLPNGKQGNARSHIRREDSGGENKRRTQRKEHRNVAYVATVPPEPLCTY